MDGQVVVMGDAPPKASDANLLTTWSDNHKNECENIMFAAGNVKRSDAKVDEPDPGSYNAGGWGNNNIYTQDQWNNDEPDNPVLTGFGTACDYPNSSKDTVLYSWVPSP